VEVIRILLNAESLETVEAGWLPPRGTPTALTPLGKLFLPLTGLVDIEAERERLGKEIAKIEQELVKVRAKLSSETFVSGAPPAVVEEHRKRESDWQAKLAEIRRVADALAS
jgi:valyl-tRNA synthetase